jgi:tetratricopeptide (TPR) repeat protein
MSKTKSNFFKANSALIVFAALAAVCLLIYGQTARFDFINLDDHAYVYLNEKVLSGLNFDSIRWSFSAFYAANWHPLTWISHAIDVSIYGAQNVGAFHAVNVFFHLVDSFLAFVVFRKMTGSIWKSAIVAALFAVHPAHVESVAWISERKDVLSTFFWLLTMLAYFRYVDFQRRNAETRREEGQRTKDKGRVYYFLTILFFALGLLTKPMLVTLPFVLLLCDFWALERLKTFKDLPRLTVEKIPLFALAFASCVITFMAQKAGGAVHSLELLPLQTRFFNSAIACAKYVVMLFYPINLGILYPYDANINYLHLTGAFVLLIAVTAFCIRQIRRRKYLLMGWLWFLGTLVPVIGLVQVGGQSMADRYTYVPYFGLFIMLVWGAGDVFKYFNIDKKAVAAICAIVLSILGVLAFIQTSHWRNSETLYRHSISVTENNYFLIKNLCLYYIDNTSTEFAEQRCTELLEPSSPSPDAHNSLGVLRVGLGKYDEAVRSFEKSLELNPDDKSLYANISIARAKQGRLEEAEKSLQTVFESDIGNLNREQIAYACNILGLSFLENKRADEAIYYFRKALELQPDYTDAKDNLKNAKGEK